MEITTQITKIIATMIILIIVTLILRKTKGCYERWNKTVLLFNKDINHGTDCKSVVSWF